MKSNGEVMKLLKEKYGISQDDLMEEFKERTETEVEMEKNKKALTDQEITKLNYTIEHLIEHGEKHEWKDRVVYLVIKDGKRLFYSIEGGVVLLCANRKEFSPLMVHTVRGEAGYNENPKGVLEVAEELGVFDEY